MPTNTVLGIGIGLFLIILIWILSLFVCVVFSRATGLLSYLGIVMILFAALFTIILLVLPRADLTPPTAKIYDFSVVYRSLLIAGAVLFLLIGLVAYLVMQIMEQVRAKPLHRLKLS